MFSIDSLINSKNNTEEFAQSLNAQDIKQLVDILSEKDDNIRYAALLALKSRSEKTRDVYEYWDEFAKKLQSDNSYQRSIGLMLLAENAKWDKADKFSTVADIFLFYCDDEKFITARQCIQSLKKIIPYKKQLSEKISENLMKIDIQKRKDTQRKLLLMDILGVLCEIQKANFSDKIQEYINKALTGGTLDKKSIKDIEKLLK